MDQDAFRRTYRQVNECFCAFEKAVLTGHCQCSEAHKFCIAEREGVHCNSDRDQQQCLQLLDILRTQARFALRASAAEHNNLLPHGKAIRIQVGGLRGLHAALHPGEPVPARIDDVAALVRRSRQHFGSLEQLPFSQIMQQIAAWQPRIRSRRRKGRRP